MLQAQPEAAGPLLSLPRSHALPPCHEPVGASTAARPRRCRLSCQVGWSMAALSSSCASPWRTFGGVRPRRSETLVANSSTGEHPESTPVGPNASWSTTLLMTDFLADRWQSVTCLAALDENSWDRPPAKLVARTLAPRWKTFALEENTRISRVAFFPELGPQPAVPSPLHAFQRHDAAWTRLPNDRAAALQRAARAPQGCEVWARDRIATRSRALTRVVR